MGYQVIETAPGIFTVCYDDGTPVTDFGEPEYSGDDAYAAWRMVEELEREARCQEKWELEHMED